MKMLLILAIVALPASSLAFDCECERPRDVEELNPAVLDTADVVVLATVGESRDRLFVDEVQRGEIDAGMWHEVRFGSCGVDPGFGPREAVRVALTQGSSRLEYSVCTAHRLPVTTMPGLATRVIHYMQRRTPEEQSVSWADERPFTAELRAMCSADGYAATVERLRGETSFLEPVAEDADREKRRNFAERQKVLMACALESREWAAAAEHERNAGKLRARLVEEVFAWAARSDASGPPWGSPANRFGEGLSDADRLELVDPDLPRQLWDYDHPLIFEGLADFFDHPDATLAERLAAALALERAALRSPKKAAEAYRKRARSIESAGLFESGLQAQNERWEAARRLNLQLAESEAAANASLVASHVGKQVARYEQAADEASLDEAIDDFHESRRTGAILGGVSTVLVIVLIVAFARRRKD